TLANLRALRERQKNTYSVVPYLGRRGDSRKPLYVECAGAGTGVVFHPERTTLTGLALTEERIRQELDQRLAGRSEDAARPYVLMLVRPDGIMNYYRVQSAVAGAKIDFGYEFVEAHWVLAFSSEDGGAGQPWMAAAKVPSPLPPPPPSPTAKVAVAARPGVVGSQQLGDGGGRPGSGADAVAASPPSGGGIGPAWRPSGGGSSGGGSPSGGAAGMPIGLPPGAGGTGSTQQPRESADAGAPASPAGQGAKRA